MAVKNIILDLGGVLLNLDYDLMSKNFADLGILDVFSKQKQTGFMDDWEEGKFNQIYFLTELKKLGNLTDPDDEQKIKDAWNSILLDFPKERLELLQTLQSKYRLFLYSNTNEIHIESFESSLQTVHQVEGLHLFFEKVYYSNVLGIRKPKSEGFLHILKENTLLAEETIFIDDSPQHIVGAKNAGITSFYLNLQTQNIHSLLRDLNLI
jgi:FMN phosphatase YigB (HAD superfamily)